MDDDFPTVNTDILAWVGDEECRISCMDVSFGLKLVSSPHQLDYRPQFGSPFTVPLVCPLELQLAWKYISAWCGRASRTSSISYCSSARTPLTAPPWQTLQDECRHAGTPLERFDWLLDTTIRQHPGWSARVAKDSQGGGMI
ncbi:hypothetical protein [Pseudoduganella sp. HUAS MS19]